MKKIVRYLRDYIKGNFNAPLYVITIVFTAILVYFNFRYDFEDSVIDKYYGKNIRILWYFLMHGVPYYVVCLFIVVFTKNRSFLKNVEFWIISLLGFLFLGADRGTYYSNEIAAAISSNRQTFRFIYENVTEWISILTTVIPLTIMYFLFFRKQFPHFYGINRKNVNVYPYFIMLGIMTPLIALASFQTDFLAAYPTYPADAAIRFAEFTGTDIKWLVLLYESSYAFGFFIVEIFFRGYLIFGISKYLGDDVVLPMATTYCVLHFGKPLGEAISSFFGGYILGVLALRTKNIYGGIIVHIGIALLMELFAYLNG